MDIVFIRELRIETVIGIFDWEREIRQTVVLDLEMGSDVAKAALRDEIEDALNYKSVAKRLIQFVSESRFQLVETLAESCAQLILEEFSLETFSGFPGRIYRTLLAHPYEQMYTVDEFVQYLKYAGFKIHDLKKANPFKIARYFWLVASYDSNTTG